MVGVGSSSALNAFNIGREATGETAVGQAIKAIVKKADKMQIAGAGQEGSLASGIGTAQFKDQLEQNQRGDVFGIRPDGQPSLIAGDVNTGRNKFINLKPEDFDTESLPANERKPFFGSKEREAQFYEKNPQNINNPANLTPSNDFDFSNFDPNQKLTPEQEAEWKRQNGML